jgi:glucose/arabinose dehydrogenase
VVLSGLVNPTVLQFASDGRIFVGQKNGVIKVFQSLTDMNPVTFADLSGEVDDYWDRGLLGLALPQNFPTDPYVYALYAYDAPIGGTAPVWNDGCPTPPGPTTDGCIVSGRVSRLQISGNVMTGIEQVLIKDWCQQFPSHSIGTLLFGRDGDLYVTGGDGASFNNVDYGQYGATYAGDQANPCGDPPGAVGTVAGCAQGWHAAWPAGRTYFRIASDPTIRAGAVLSSSRPGRDFGREPTLLGSRITAKRHWRNLFRDSPFGDGCRA